MSKPCPRRLLGESETYIEPSQEGAVLKGAERKKGGLSSSKDRNGIRMS